MSLSLILFLSLFPPLVSRSYLRHARLTRSKSTPWQDTESMPVSVYPPTNNQPVSLCPSTNMSNIPDAVQFSGHTPSDSMAYTTHSTSNKIASMGHDFPDSISHQDRMEIQSKKESKTVGCACPFCQAPPIQSPPPVSFYISPVSSYASLTDLIPPETQKISPESLKPKQEKIQDSEHTTIISTRTETQNSERDLPLSSLVSPCTVSGVNPYTSSASVYPSLGIVSHSSPRLSPSSVQSTPLSSPHLSPSCSPHLSPSSIPSTPSGSPRISPTRLPIIPSPLLASSPCSPSSSPNSPGSSFSPLRSSPSSSSLYRPSIPSPLALPTSALYSPHLIKTHTLSPSTNLSPVQNLKRSLSFTFGAKSKSPLLASRSYVARRLSSGMAPKSLSHRESFDYLDSPPSPSMTSSPRDSPSVMTSLHGDSPPVSIMASLHGDIPSVSIMASLHGDSPPVSIMTSLHGNSPANKVMTSSQHGDSPIITNENVFACRYGSTPRSTTSLTTPDSSHTDSDVSPTVIRRHSDTAQELSPAVTLRKKSVPKDVPRFSISIEDESAVFQQKGIHCEKLMFKDTC